MISEKKLDNIQERLARPSIDSFGYVEVQDMLSEIRALRKVYEAGKKWLSIEDNHLIEFAEAIAAYESGEGSNGK